MEAVELAFDVPPDDLEDEVLETEDPVEEPDFEQEPEPKEEEVDMPAGWAAASADSSPEPFDEALVDGRLDESRDETVGESLQESLPEPTPEEEAHDEKPTRKTRGAKRSGAARSRKASSRANAPAKRARRSASNDKTVEWKLSKPVMERRRRARINSALAELKALLTDVIRRENVNSSKMEKADILELAVSHLRLAQSRDSGDSDSKVKGSSGGRSSEEEFAAGYNACLEQTRRFLVAQEQNGAQTKGSALASALEVEFRAKLVEHLAEQLTSRGDQQQPRAGVKVPRSENTSTSSSSSSSSSTASSEPNATTQQASPTAVSSTVARQAAAAISPSRAKSSEQKNGAIATTSANNGGSGGANGNGVLTGRLPSGELALVLPVGNTVPAVDVGVLGSLSLLASSPLGALLGLSPGLPPPAQAASAPRPMHSRPAAVSTAPVCATGPTGFLVPQPLPPLPLTSAAIAGHLAAASAAGPVVPPAPPVTAAAPGCELGLLGALSQLLTLTASASSSASASPHSASAAAVCSTAALSQPALKAPASGTVAPEGNELLQRLLTLQILGALAGTVNNNNGNIKAEHSSHK